MEDRLIKQVSQIEEDQTQVAAIYGPLGKDLSHEFKVRGVVVHRLNITKQSDRGQMYRLCVFPGHHQQWVNEGNITGKRVPRFAGELHPHAKEAAPAEAA